jgi:hypothetical protein
MMLKRPVGRPGVLFFGEGIAYCPDFNGLRPLDPAVAQSVREAARAFEDLGASLEERGFDASSMHAAIDGTRGSTVFPRTAEFDRKA